MPAIRTVTVALACAAASTGCAGSRPAATAPPSSPVTRTTPPNTPVTPRVTSTPSPLPSANPFTGRPGGDTGPVLAVKIDNTGAGHPQIGLRDADIVYVEQVEGGLTRIMAVFSSRLPARVGPVRSARISDLHILRQFGRPAFAFSGAQRKMLPFIARAPLYDVSDSRVDRAYYRDGTRPLPYNLFASPRRLRAAAPHASRARDIGFRFGPAPAGGTATTSMSVRYPSARFTFRWSAARKEWLVWQDGKTDEAAGSGRLGAPTIVVQWCRTTRSRFHDFLGGYTPLITTTGTGTAVVLGDGEAYDARWRRPNEDAGTTFTTADGRPMTFHPGQVWIFLAAKSPTIP